MNLTELGSKRQLSERFQEKAEERGRASKVADGQSEAREKKRKNGKRGEVRRKGPSARGTGRGE